VPAYKTRSCHEPIIPSSRSGHDLRKQLSTPAGSAKTIRMPGSAPLLG
jgi:hypothetical protein